MASEDGQTSKEFKEQDRVEYVGPVPTDEKWAAMPGDRGTIVTSGSLEQSPREWVVRFDRGPVGVCSEDELRFIE
jgi:hypothetical protein